MIDPRIRHIVQCAMSLVNGYEFKMTDVLDEHRRCVANRHRVALHQLDRALRHMGDELEEL